MRSSHDDPIWYRPEIPILIGGVLTVIGLAIGRTPITVIGVAVESIGIVMIVAVLYATRDLERR